MAAGKVGLTGGKANLVDGKAKIDSGSGCNCCGCEFCAEAPLTIDVTLTNLLACLCHDVTGAGMCGSMNPPGSGLTFSPGTFTLSATDDPCVWEVGQSYTAAYFTRTAGVCCSSGPFPQMSDQIFIRATRTNSTTWSILANVNGNLNGDFVALIGTGLFTNTATDCESTVNGTLDTGTCSSGDGRAAHQGSISIDPNMAP